MVIVLNRAGGRSAAPYSNVTITTSNFQETFSKSHHLDKKEFLFVFALFGLGCDRQNSQSNEPDNITFIVEQRAVANDKSNEQNNAKSTNS